MKVRQHEFHVSSGVTICKHCGVSREKRHEEECDEREIIGPQEINPVQPPLSPQPTLTIKKREPTHKIFQVPRSGNLGSCHFIGVIDASGSMQHYWKDVAKHYNLYMPKKNLKTITFDAKPRICETNILTDNLKNHGGGTTNIVAAFKEMDRIIDSIPSGQPVTVLFISDGQDNHGGGMTNLEERLKTELGGNKGRFVTFLCLGIQKQFPTFMSMQLREIYHNTQSTIPALFLIEYASEKAFYNKFESMQPFFRGLEKRHVSPKVSVVPWLPPTHEVFEGTWVSCIASDVVVDNVELTDSACSITTGSVTELFRGYVQDLETLAMAKDTELKEKATVALHTMNQILELLKNETGVDLLAKENLDSTTWKGFKYRAMTNEVLRRQFWAKSYYENVELLSKGQGAASLGEWEAAKRLGIGTMLGKHQQKILSSKGLEFEQLKSTFLMALNSVKLHPSNYDLQTQRSLFAEPDFAEGFSYVPSQFDLVEALPIIGIPIRVKRFDGINTNIFLLQVRHIAFEYAPMTSLSLIKLEGTDRSYRTNLPNGNGEVNSILPLLKPDDRDLRPLISHPLFHLVMTHNVAVHVDSVCTDAYLSLLANTYLYALTEPPSAQRTELLNDICTTCWLVYQDDTEFNAFRKNMVENPNQFIKSGEGGYQDLAQAVLHLAIISKVMTLTTIQLSILMDNLYVQVLARNIEAFGLSSILESDNLDHLIPMWKKSVRDEFDGCFTLGSVRDKVRRVAAAGIKTEHMSDDINIRPKISKLVKEDHRIHLGHLISLQEVCVPEHPTSTDNEFLRLIYVAHTRITTPNYPVEAAPGPIECKKVLLKAVSGSLLTGMISQLSVEMVDEYATWYQELHQRIVPFSYNKLRALCKEKNIDVKKLNYNAETGLVANACMAEGCPFFLHTSTHFRNHLGVWGVKLPPAFHKTVRIHRDRHPQFILAVFLQQKEARSHSSDLLNLEQYQSSEAEVLEYIELVQAAYREIDGDKGGPPPPTYKQKS